MPDSAPIRTDADVHLPRAPVGEPGSQLDLCWRSQVVGREPPSTRFTLTSNPPIRRAREIRSRTGLGPPPLCLQTARYSAGRRSSWTGVPSFIFQQHSTVVLGAQASIGAHRNQLDFREQFGRSLMDVAAGFRVTSGRVVVGAVRMGADVAVVGDDAPGEALATLPAQPIPPGFGVPGLCMTVPESRMAKLAIQAVSEAMRAEREPVPPREIWR